MKISKKIKKQLAAQNVESKYIPNVYAQKAMDEKAKNAILNPVSEAISVKFVGKRKFKEILKQGQTVRHNKMSIREALAVTPKYRIFDGVPHKCDEDGYWVPLTKVVAKSTKKSAKRK